MKYRLYCEMCGYNRWTDGTDIGDLVPYKRCQIQTGIPKFDQDTKKIVTKFANRASQFKCPSCGRIITPKKQPEIKDEQQQNDWFGRSKGSITGPAISQETAPGTETGHTEIRTEPRLLVQPANLPENTESSGETTDGTFPQSGVVFCGRGNAASK